MKKRGFALIAAIFFIIIVATIAVTTLSTATMTARDTVNLHAREQAILLAQSATEFAVMAMQTHHYPDTDFTETNKTKGANCLDRINLTYPLAAPNSLYDITVDLYYIDRNITGGKASSCKNVIGATGLAVDSAGAAQSSHAAIIDVTVRSTANLGGMPITYNRRTLQKP